MWSLWEVLYEGGSELVVSGNDHVYERFAPQTPTGALDVATGIRQFIVGTGGRGLYTFGTPLPNSEVRNSDTFGVLRITLRAGAYDWSFLPQPGKTFSDTGSSNCH